MCEPRALRARIMTIYFPWRREWGGGLGWEVSGDGGRVCTEVTLIKRYGRWRVGDFEGGGGGGCQVSRWFATNSTKSWQRRVRCRVPVVVGVA